jgi:anti-sigma regulatory factor (Ser/Thr protein kinase)
LARICILFILYFCSTLFSQAQQAIHYNTDNGLPSNHVYQIEEDPDGFMWFTTSMGVTKFNGKEFKTYTTQDGLPTNDIWRIEATDNGKIWFFAKTKKMGYIYNDSVFSYPLEGNSTQHPQNFIIDKNSVSFTAINNNKYGNYELKGSSWVMDDFVSREYSIQHLTKKGVFITKNLYIHNSDNEHYLFSDNFNILYTFKEPKQTKNITAYLHKIISKLYYFKKNDNLIIANPYGLVLYNLKDSTIYASYLFRKKYTINEIQNNNPEVQQYGNNYQVSRMNEWVSFDKKLNVIERREFDDNEIPVHIFKDQTGNFWKANQKSGITVYPSTSINNKYYFKDNKIQTVNYENGILFINISNKGWYVLDTANGDAKCIISNIGKVYEMGYHDQLKTYYFYNSRSFWYGKDLNKLKKINYINIPLANRGIINCTAGAKSIIEDENFFLAITIASYLKLDSNFNPIFIENQNTDRWYTQGGKALIKHNGKIYVGGDGLYEVKGYNIKPKPIKNPLLQAAVNTIIPFNKEFMLVGTDGFGAYFYDGESIVIPIRGSEGNTINKIIIDKDNIWMATGKGIHRYNGTNVYNFDKTESIFDEDGLLENNINSICIAGDKLYVAQDNGLVVIKLDKDKYKKNIKPYYAGSEYYNSKTNTYTIEYGANISIPFKVMNLPSQKYIRYYYKTNTDDHWTPSEVPTLVLGKQPPGAYTISFLAIDQHKNIGKMSISLVVIPLWYQTLFIKILALLVGLACVILVTLFFRKRTENKKKAELLLSKTLADLELKALRSQMNPHFVFNSLNAIQYYIIKNKPELSEEYLAKFSRLIRLFFEYSKYDSLKMFQEIDLLSRYLEIEKLRFENKLEYNIYVDPEIDVEDIEVPSMILQPIVENAVNHGVFHKKGNGLIILSFKRLNTSAILISIIDDGVGILAMKEIQQEDSGNYRSKSSEVIKERLKILSENKLSKWKVDYKIEDRGTINPNETGTLVEIILHYNY